VLWHIVPVIEKLKIPRNPYRPGLYYSTKTGEFYSEIPGELGVRLARLMGPSGEETRRSILDLREKTEWSRAQLAGMLGV